MTRLEPPLSHHWTYLGPDIFENSPQESRLQIEKLTMMTFLAARGGGSVAVFGSLLNNLWICFERIVRKIWVHVGDLLGVFFGSFCGRSFDLFDAFSGNFEAHLDFVLFVLGFVLEGLSLQKLQNMCWWFFGRVHHVVSFSNRFWNRFRSHLGPLGPSLLLKQ